MKVRDCFINDGTSVGQSRCFPTFGEKEPGDISNLTLNWAVGSEGRKSREEIRLS